MIKTCPICGGPPTIVYRKTFQEYHIVCDTPGCEILFGFMSTQNQIKYPNLVFRTEKKAIDSWNSRPEQEMVEVKRRSY